MIDPETAFSLAGLLAMIGWGGLVVATFFRPVRAFIWPAAAFVIPALLAWPTSC